MSKKLQNVKAVQQMLDGSHKFQTKKTTGFSDAKLVAKKNERHEIGDTWEETDSTGNIFVIEQKDGFRIRKTKNSEIFQELRDDLKSFPNCRKETCTCSGIHPIDKKMQVIHKMCFDCVIDMEHEMTKAGTYEEYSKNKIRENALAWLAAAERDVNMLKQTYTQAAEFVTNSDGVLETWGAKMTPAEFEETVQSQFNKFKENFLKNLDGESNENN
jgi:hypothetical protein